MVIYLKSKDSSKLVRGALMYCLILLHLQVFLYFLLLTVLEAANLYSRLHIIFPSEVPAVMLLWLYYSRKWYCIAFNCFNRKINKENFMGGGRHPLQLKICNKQERREDCWNSWPSWVKLFSSSFLCVLKMRAVPSVCPSSTAVLTYHCWGVCGRRCGPVHSVQGRGRPGPHQRITSVMKRHSSHLGPPLSFLLHLALHCASLWNGCCRLSAWVRK